MPPKVDVNKCIGCRTCVDACPNNVLDLVEGVAYVARPKDCEECGLCEAICKQEAIKLQSHNPE